MGKASREKWERKIKAATLDMASTNNSPKVRWSESQVLWCCITTFLTIVLTAMKGDILLWIAWGISFVPVWIVCKNLCSTALVRVVMCLVGIAVTGLSLHDIHDWLKPPPAIVASVTPNQIESKIRGWISDTKLYKLLEVKAADPTEDFRLYISTAGFNGKVVKFKNSDKISIQTGITFDNNTNPSFDTLNAREKEQLRRDIEIELYKMDSIGFLLERNPQTDDFRFMFEKVVFFSSLTEEEFQKAIFRVRAASKLAQTIVASRLKDIKK